MNFKKRKNYIGDSLLETIIAFAIVAIVGLVMATGIGAASSIKNNTTWLKNDNLEADADLQNKEVNIGKTTKASIYKLGEDGNIKKDNGDYVLLTPLKNSESITITQLKGESEDQKISFVKYISVKVDKGKKPNQKNTAVIGNGGFGMSGQWFMRVYLDRDAISSLSYGIANYTESGKTENYDTKNRKFYIEVSLTGAFPNENGDLEVGKLLGAFGGRYRMHNDNGGYIQKDTSRDWDWSSNFGTSGGVTCTGLKRYSDTNISSWSESNDFNSSQAVGTSVTFPENGVLNLFYEFNVAPEYDSETQFFDISFFWSSMTSYGLTFNVLIDEDNDGKYDYLTDPIQRIAVYKRDGSSYNDEKYDKPFYKHKPDENTVPTKDFILDYDGHDPNKYIYFWDKGGDKTSPSSNVTNQWNVDFNKENTKSILGIGNYRTTYNSNDFNGDKEKSFREWLRTYDTGSTFDGKKIYELYIDWRVANGIPAYQTTMSTKEEQKVNWAFYCYYLLDVYNNTLNNYQYCSELRKSGESANLADFKSYVTQRFNESSNSNDGADYAAKLYFFIYDKDIYNEVKSYNYKAMKNYWNAYVNADGILKELVNGVTTDPNFDSTSRFLSVLYVQNRDLYNLVNTGIPKYIKDNSTEDWAQKYLYNMAVLIYSNEKNGTSYTYKNVITYNSSTTTMEKWNDICDIMGYSNQKIEVKIKDVIDEIKNPSWSDNSGIFLEFLKSKDPVNYTKFNNYFNSDDVKNKKYDWGTGQRSQYDKDVIYAISAMIYSNKTTGTNYTYKDVAYNSATQNDWNEVVNGLTKYGYLTNQTTETPAA